MEEGDDDFYGSGPARDGATNGRPPQLKDEQMDDASEGEDDEDEDDEDDVQFTLERPEAAKTEQGKSSTRQAPLHDRATSADTKPAKPAPLATKQESTRHSSTAPPPDAVRGTLTYDGKEGKDFPELRTSTIDVNAIPVWPGANKPIIDLDLDADLAEHSKPWRLPGTDQTDFFNYGFDEYTWTQYCIKQQSMSQSIADQKNADAQMKAMFGAMAGPGGPAGMPDMEQMMQFMMGGPGMGGSQGQGGIPPGMDQFMQMMGQGGPGMNPGQQFQQHQGAFGSAQNSVSPAPGPGQGFQPPPQGPQGATLQGDQGSMGGGQQGGGGRGRNRRGRW
ncbi:hypothetical protein M433DRAFT_153148 [Acidomyces richmondensis BFW]|nr:MAG: hypothetical protein FE78DRAFT_92502 [Acidomyces sp. 'richmondensis']KYG46621.1 hypothetical protein M433DRAFT_153148 [Acidomyces richmondensis BFW]